MEKYTCIAIDDDVVALKIISSLVNKAEQLELKGTYSDAVAGAGAIMSLQPDIVFLDVQMPDLSGLEILKNLTSKPEIILVTSQEKFALEAFEFDVTDYLLKPIENFARFLKAVNKATANLSSRSKPSSNASSGSTNIFIKSDSLLVKLDVSSITYIEAYGDYVKIHTDEKTHLVYSKFKTVEDKLPEDGFVRVHRSYIVSIDRIKNIDQSNLQIGDKIIPISNSYRPKLLDRIKML
ncbi:LytR/AlgR family response regulator transcription factor [Marinoscillum pacificum]|uniref:LytR/AlgR family response regulator transcription factor n=1 Tax=Marinoscillum pacificum TaxID=392723 RepID=UPI00215835A4|nr:LytTR family DNA-binding domain-containing protein [Marinoscillum pacificum]